MVPVWPDFTISLHFNHIDPTLVPGTHSMLSCLLWSLVIPVHAFKNVLHSYSLSQPQLWLLCMLMSICTCLICLFTHHLFPASRWTPLRKVVSVFFHCYVCSLQHNIRRVNKGMNKLSAQKFTRPLTLGSYSLRIKIKGCFQKG